MKTVRCTCGYVASHETAKDLLADVEAHIHTEHSRKRNRREAAVVARILEAVRVDGERSAEGAEEA